jgi:hypothetical protein
MIQETYVTQETGMMIPEVISNYAYCKQIKKLNYNDELGNIQRLEVKNTREFGMYFEIVCQAPTHAVLAKWLRDVHNLIVLPYYNYECDNTPYTFLVYRKNNSQQINAYENDYETYEQALEAGLFHALTLIENDNTKQN